MRLSKSSSSARLSRTSAFVSLASPASLFPRPPANLALADADDRPRVIDKVRAERCRADDTSALARRRATRRGSSSSSSHTARGLTSGSDGSGAVPNTFSAGTNDDSPRAAWAYSVAFSASFATLASLIRSRMRDRRSSIFSRSSRMTLTALGLDRRVRGLVRERAPFLMRVQPLGLVRVMVAQDLRVRRLDDRVLASELARVKRLEFPTASSADASSRGTRPSRTAPGTPVTSNALAPVPSRTPPRPLVLASIGLETRSRLPFPFPIPIWFWLAGRFGGRERRPPRRSPGSCAGDG